MSNSVLAERQCLPKFPDIFSAGAILTKPYRLALNIFHTKIRLCLHKGRYTVKTVSEPAELEKVLQLRREVFFGQRAGKSPYLSIDIDRFDLSCDHIMVAERATGKIVGTYRLNSSLFTKSFYSAKEFDMDNVLKLAGTKLELGRACIHKDFRNGMIIALLWRGIREYMKMTGTKYLFGCSSVDTTDQAEIGRLHKYFSFGHYSPDSFRVYPRDKYAVVDKSLMRGHVLSGSGEIDLVHNYSVQNGYKKDSVKVAPGDDPAETGRDTTGETAAPENNQAKGRVALPPLLHFYLKAGAVICGEPALDKHFGCADFFTLLDVDCMNKSMERRFA